MNTIAHPIYESVLHDPDDLCNTRDRLIELIESVELLASIDALAVTGASGLVIGGLLSIALRLPLVIVRKENEECHSRYNVQGPENFKYRNFIIVDDLIDSGKTIRYIIEKLSTYDCTCVGVFLYADGYPPSSIAGVRVYT